MNANKALLIVAHGSRREQSNNEIKQLTLKVKQQAGQRFQQVDYAFLELTEPSIESGIDHCVANGATEIIIMPYFLAAGRHVVEDVPGIVKLRQEQYPAVNLRISTYLGALPVMTDLILETVEGGECLCGKARSACDFPGCVREGAA